VRLELLSLDDHWSRRRSVAVQWKEMWQLAQMQFRSQEITNIASRDASAGNDNADKRMQIIPDV